MAWISGNFYMSQEQSDNNAKEMYRELAGNYGWSLSAVAAVAGNFQQESGLNPGIWQNLDEGNTHLGLGLGQWTPATKLLNWASENGFTWSDGNAQCKFLNDNAGQWHNSGRPGISPSPPFTWEEFTKNEGNIDSLTTYFYWYWEDPGYSDDTLGVRVTAAHHYYTLLSGEEPPGPGPGPGPGPSPTPGTWGKMNTVLKGCLRRL